jgi:hypothetical protein
LTVNAPHTITALSACIRCAQRLSHEYPFIQLSPRFTQIVQCIPFLVQRSYGWRCSCFTESPLPATTFSAHGHVTALSEALPQTHSAQPQMLSGAWTRPLQSLCVTPQSHLQEIRVAETTLEILMSTQSFTDTCHMGGGRVWALLQYYTLPANIVYAPSDRASRRIQLEYVATGT